MNIIDFHTHIYPEKIAEKAVENVGHFYQLEMHGNGTPENLIRMGSEVGISRYVVHSPALTSKNVPTINRFIADSCKKYPQFIGFGTLHADSENLKADIDEILSLGLKGIKIHPDSQRFCLDDEKMMPAYNILQEARLPVLFHTGDYRYDYSHPRRLVYLMQKCPNLVCIAAHFGGWSVFDLALEYLKDTSCYLDISSSMSFLGAKRSRELIELYTPDRMLFGSDFPMWNPKEEYQKFMNLGFSEKDNEKILYRNAERILNISLS
jgi:Predicted metal-dependent hydrolase of the TIM-barrel fold